MRALEDDLQRVLIFAPVGRDGDIATVILKEAGLQTALCKDIESLVAQLDGCASAVITEEALLGSDRLALATWVRRQPPWSDFPFVLLTLRGGSPNAQLPELLGNVTVLERPFHPAVLINSTKSALRARRRQREVEGHLAERQRTHDRQSLLIRELHHRVKNTLATVQSLLGATARSKLSIGEFYDSFSTRILSLSRTHDLLTEDYWQMAQLGQMLRNELDHHQNGAPDRIMLDGPCVELSADLAVPTGMAIHELTTNSVKYGALSVPHGRLKVAWRIRTSNAGKRLELDWSEHDGPHVVAPDRKGFGTTLLQRVLAQQCDADISLDYAPKGLRFTMNVPLIQERLVPKY